MTAGKTTGAWLALAVFAGAGTLLLVGDIGCLIELVRTGRITVGESAESAATFHQGAGAVALLVLGFLMSAACIACGVTFFRDRKQ